MTILLRGDPLGWSVPGPTAVAVGVFDGVHIGHQAVAWQIVEAARRQDLVPTALTFDPHPLEFLDPASAPLLLTSVEQRCELLGDLGVEVVGVLPFPQIRGLPPEVFATEVLGNRLRAKLVSVGADFRFGRDRAGDTRLLEALGGEIGMSVAVVQLIGEFRGEKASSSRIRELIVVGDVEHAAILLGRWFELRGPVMHGDSRGRELGFPTANLHVPDRMAVPADGVYAAFAMVGKKAHRAVVNIGSRPTFGPGQAAVEAHLLDFDGDLYGTSLGLRFVSRLRNERRFDSVEELVEQIASDVDAGASILAAVEA